MTRLRWCLGLLGAGALVLVFVVSSFDACAAGQKVAGSGKVIALLSETKMLPGDDPRHEITMVGRTDAERSDAFGEAQVTVVAIADYVAGTGTHRGWRTATSQDGDKRFSAYEGKTRATPKPGGPPEVAFDGKKGDDLGLALVSFYNEHRRCGKLSGGVEDDGRGDYVMWTCSCGAVLRRPVEEPGRGEPPG